MGVPGAEMEAVRGDWALFYWRLRYAFKEIDQRAADGSIVKSFAVFERFTFKDQARALKF